MAVISNNSGNGNSSSTNQQNVLQNTNIHRFNNNSNNNSNNNQINQTERANANNANNIRNAADVAMASKHPYAVAAGAAVKALDKATGGKSTDAFGKLATRTMQRMPNGKKLQNASNNLSESGASDKIGSAASIANAANGKGSADPNSKVGNGPTKSSTKNDPGAKKLQKSKSSRSLNLFKNRNKKSGLSDNSSGDTNESSGDNSNNENTNSVSQDDDMISKATARFKIRIIIFTAVIAFVVLFIITIICTILGIDISLTIPAANQSTYGTEDFSSTYEKGTSDYDNEIAYYEKLKSINEDNDETEDNGEKINTNYIHAILIYKYYIYDDSENNTQNDSSKENKIDYKKMNDMVDPIVSIINLSKKDDKIDYEKDGELYNNLKESSDFNNYYKKELKSMNIDKLLEYIFDLANDLDNINSSDEISENN